MILSIVNLNLDLPVAKTIYAANLKLLLYL